MIELLEALVAWREGLAGSGGALEGFAFTYASRHDSTVNAGPKKYSSKLDVKPLPSTNDELPFELTETVNVGTLKDENLPDVTAARALLKSALSGKFNPTGALTHVLVDGASRPGPGGSELVLTWRGTFSRAA